MGNETLPTKYCVDLNDIMVVWNRMAESEHTLVMGELEQLRAAVRELTVQQTESKLQSVQYQETMGQHIEKVTAEWNVKFDDQRQHIEKVTAEWNVKFDDERNWCSQELQTTSKQIHESVSRESRVRSTQIEEFMERLELDAFNQKFTEIISSHQQLTASCEAWKQELEIVANRWKQPIEELEVTVKNLINESLALESKERQMQNEKFSLSLAEILLSHDKLLLAHSDLEGSHREQNEKFHESLCEIILSHNNLLTSHSNLEGSHREQNEKFNQSLSEILLSHDNFLASHNDLEGSHREHTEKFSESLSDILLSYDKLWASHSDLEGFHREQIERFTALCEAWKEPFEELKIMTNECKLSLEKLVEESHESEERCMQYQKLSQSDLINLFSIRPPPPTPHPLMPQQHSDLQIC